MISDHDAAKLCAAIYDYPSDQSAAFDHYDDGTEDDHVCWAFKRFPNVDVIVMRGSVSRIDWLRDFDVWVNPFGDKKLRHVHPGFLLGMRNTWEEVASMLDGRPVIVTGHSLGAARAAILTAIMTLEGKAPVRRVVFGEPKPGFLDFNGLIASVPGASYCNGDDAGHDLVTEVPFSFPPLEYTRATPLISVSASPTQSVMGFLGLFSYHHMPLYVQALGALPGGS